MIPNEIIPLSNPCLKGNEWHYVKDCLDKGWIASKGDYIEKFERELCGFIKVKYAVSVNSGTAALQTALRLIGLQHDEEVIVPTVTFIATINAVNYFYAHPIFMDCDAYYNIDIEKIIEFLKRETVFKGGHTYNRKTKRMIRAVIPVHVYGNAVDLEDLWDVCAERNIRVIEDATESLGTFYVAGKFKGKFTGTIGDIGCYSFNGNKIITTAGGGLLVTESLRLARRARYLASQAKDDETHYIHNEVGYNFRLNNIQAAIGLAQFESLAEILKKKKENYQYYQNLLKGIDGLNLSEVPPYASCNYWMYALQVDPGRYGYSKNEIIRLCLENHIEARSLWCLNHIQNPYRRCQNYKIENAYKMFDRTLNIPSSVGLSQKQIKRVVQLLKKGAKHAF